MKYVIYKIINTLNGKSYIGFTKDFARRKSEHLRRDGKCRLLTDAMIKYGNENFSWEVVYETTDRDFAQNIMEPYCINLHRSYCKEHGYNLSKGGEGAVGVSLIGAMNPFYGRHHTEETKRKIRESKLGRIQPQHEKEKQIFSQIGKKCSQQTREKLRKANKGHAPWNKGKVGVYTEESNRKRSETERRTKAKGHT